MQTVSHTLDSIVNQIDDSFEVVVVDNFSNDGTQEILKEYAERHRIRLTLSKCTRGKGRQLAFENSSGAHIISNVEFDNPLKPNLIQLVQSYQRSCEGSLLFALSPTATNAWGPAGISIMPRALVERLGGWRDIQIYEDTDLFARAAGVGSYRWGWFDILEKADDRSDWPKLNRLRYRYEMYRDWSRLGGKLKFRGNSPRGVALRILAGIDAKFMRNYPNEFLDKFNSMDSRHAVTLNGA